MEEKFREKKIKNENYSELKNIYVYIHVYIGKGGKVSRNIRRCYSEYEFWFLE